MLNGVETGELSSLRPNTKVGSSFAHKYYIWVEGTNNNKHSSLLWFHVAIVPFYVFDLHPVRSFPGCARLKYLTFKVRKHVLY
jgi:hypothetical protein